MKLERTIICGLLVLLMMFMSIVPVSADEKDPSLCEKITQTYFTSKDTSVKLVNGGMDCYWDSNFKFNSNPASTSHGFVTATYLPLGDDPVICPSNFLFDFVVYTPNAGFNGWDQFTYITSSDESLPSLKCELRTANIYVGDTRPSPEFPTSLLPVTMIIGILGTVFYIQRTREY